MPLPTTLTRFCKDCNQEKEVSLFAFANSRTGQRRPQCKPCTKAREASQLAARRQADGEKPTSKCCTNCKLSKPLDLGHFKKAIKSPHGFSPECKDCLRERGRIWASTEAGKALRNRNMPKYKEKKAVRAKEYQKKNREKINSYLREWRANNLDRCRTLDAAWARKNKAKRTEYRHMRRAAGAFSYDVVPALKEKQKGKCAICRGLLTSLIEVDHIMPVALGGTNEASNLQLLCRTCNRSKGAKHPIDYMQSRGFLL